MLSSIRNRSKIVHCREQQILEAFGSVHTCALLPDLQAPAGSERKFAVVPQAVSLKLTQISSQTCAKLTKCMDTVEDVGLTLHNVEDWSILCWLLRNLRVLRHVVLRIDNPKVSLMAWEVLNTSSNQLFGGEAERELEAQLVEVDFKMPRTFGKDEWMRDEVIFAVEVCFGKCGLMAGVGHK